jgi:hypothetical protein
MNKVLFLLAALFCATTSHAAEGTKADTLSAEQLVERYGVSLQDAQDALKHHRIARNLQPLKNRRIVETHATNFRRLYGPTGTRTIADLNMKQERRARIEEYFNVNNVEFIKKGIKGDIINDAFQYLKMNPSKKLPVTPNEFNDYSKLHKAYLAQKKVSSRARKENIAGKKIDMGKRKPIIEDTETLPDFDSDKSEKEADDFVNQFLALEN